MKISPYRSRWGDALYLGPFLEWPEWCFSHHEFSIGLQLGPLIFGLNVKIWDWFEFIEQEAIPKLVARGLSESFEEARQLCDRLYQQLVSQRYDDGKKVNARAELKKLVAYGQAKQ